MVEITAEDGVKLACIEAGSGFPILFVHEFAGEARSFEPQLRFFARRYRAIAYNARGYPPSDVPEDPALYSQAHATGDIAAVLRGLGVARAHIVGLSMGAFATLHFGLRYPEMAASLV
ncbi:MAG: alpha/beta fold hydrolase, partial [Acetobacteraceae bacterium]